MYYPDGTRVAADVVHETLSGAVVEVSFTWTHRFCQEDRRDKYHGDLQSIYIMALYV